MEGLRAEADSFEPIERFAGEYAPANYLIPGEIVTFNGWEWKRYKWEVEILRYAAALLVYPMVQRPVLLVTGGLDRLLQASASNVSLWASNDFGFKSSHSELLNPFLTPRFLHTLVQLENDIYAIGGQQRLSSGKQVFLQSCEVLSLVNHSLTARSWLSAPGLNRPRSTLTAVVSAQRIYAVGGFAGEVRLAFDVEVLERGKRWRLIGVKHCMMAGVAVVRNEGDLWVMGGSDGYMETKQVVAFNTDTEQTQLLSLTLAHSVSLALPFHISSSVILSSSVPQSLPPSVLPVSPFPLSPLCYFSLVC